MVCYCSVLSQPHIWFNGFSFWRGVVEAGAAVWCIGFQKIDGQEINNFRSSKPKLR
ncbi:hypothetical protein RHMOL_Rhmol01G0226300 [Rhododendron molle]|uniref:Uncharacterized protein n=1 Tax=Rhododendron molle TaxID=49168 RepID=A0ACC0Q4N3_RHOML|nr:hypothetical protein RHMOL_Rhmol01G0226300 [Rhododendron molle]